MSSNDPHYHRKMRFEQGYRELAAQGVFRKQSPRSSIPAELWVCVAFALMANFISRLFGWLRILAYLSLVASICCLSPGAVPVFGYRHVFWDLIAAIVLLRSVWLLLSREFIK